jgi:hypothetical protein
MSLQYSFIYSVCAKNIYDQRYSCLFGFSVLRTSFLEKKVPELLKVIDSSCCDGAGLT